MGRHKKYKTDEERKAAKREAQKRFRERHPEYDKQYNGTKLGRARYLLYDYKRKDKKYNRGECTLTAEWIVDNIFSKPCNYCGETDWTKLGCDRIDNALPHTADNVVPCCGDCNKKKARYSYDDYMEMIANSP